MRLKRRIRAFLAVITISIFSLLIAAIVKARSEAQAQGRLKASYLSQALAEDVAGTLNLVACVSQMLKDRLATEGSHDLPLLKRQIQKYAPALTDISIIGADGKMVATTVSGDFRSVDFSGGDYFRDHRDNPKISFRIGKPTKSRSWGRIIVPLTRRLETEGGAFSGVALFTFDPQVFASLYRRVDPGKTGTLQIIGTDGIIRAGYAISEGQRKSVVEPFAIGDKAVAEAQSSLAGGVDYNSRIYSWRKLDSFPIVAMVGLGQDEAMGGAYQQAILLFGLGALSVGLLLAMTATLSREISRRVKQAFALNQQRHRLKDANAELIVAKRQAEEASHSKSIFLANISHELRTPLNAILGFSEIIRDQLFGNDPERYANYAADIHRAGTHLLRLVTGLLDLTKIEAGKFELHESALKLDQVIYDSLAVINGQAQSRGVNVTLQAQKGISLYADETALKQIIINLLSNAIKFTPQGGNVVLSAELDASTSLVLAIEDTGVGMTGEEIQRAMQPFQQIVSEPQARVEGTGLGLPLAARLVELHGGSLSIESTPNFGTKVLVRFPAWRIRAGENRRNFPNSPVQLNS